MESSSPWRTSATCCSAWRCLPLPGCSPGRSRLARGLRWLLLVGGALTVIALPVLAVVYGTDLEYRYEVAAIALTWITLIPGGILLTRWFRQPMAGRPAADEPTAGHDARP